MGNVPCQGERRMEGKGGGTFGRMMGLGGVWLLLVMISEISYDQQK